MAKSWIDGVKNSKKLSVFNGIGGKWTTLFQTGFDEINNLLKGAGLSLSFEKSTDEKAANVVVKTGDGTLNYEFEGNTFSRAFNGKALHGYTGLIYRPDDPKIEKAFVFLPNNPQMNTSKGVRATGINVMKCILVHEFIHACGLENADHSKDDIFNGFPQTNYGSKPDEDKIGIEKDGNYVWFPPIFLSASTVGKIQSAW